MNQRFRNVLISAFTFLGGLYFFLEFLLPEKIGDFQFGKYHEQITTGVTIVGTMAIGMGIINLVMVHGARVVKVRSGWANSFALLLGLVATLSIEGYEIVQSQWASSRRPTIEAYANYASRITSSTQEVSEKKKALDILSQKLTEERQTIGTLLPAQSRKATDRPPSVTRAQVMENFDHTLAEVHDLTSSLVSGTTSAPVTLDNDMKDLALSYHQFASDWHEHSRVKVISNFVFDGLFVPLGSAMFALLAFYIANAAYRSFRIRSREAAVMMISALVVMLGQIPHGPLYISSELPHWRLWLLQNVSTPAFRAIYFGSAIAGLAMAVRMWLSLERSPLSDNETSLASEESKSS